MSEFFRRTKARLRPHAKVHKIPIIAHKQVEAGAIGVCVAKVAEAEVMTWGGIENVMITNQIVTDLKIARLTNLARHCDLTVAVDDIENVRHLSRAASQRGVTLGAVIELEVGYSRGGITPGKAAIPLAEAILTSEGLEFRGIMAFEGHATFVPQFEVRKRLCEKSMQAVIETKDILEDAGIGVSTVSVGGTGTYNISGLYPGVTDVRAGSYAVMDVAYRRIGIDFDCALSVLSTVTSRPADDRAIIDAGLKSLPTDRGLPEIDLPGATLTTLTAEHGHLELKGTSMGLRIGDLVEVLPSNVETTMNLFDQLYATRGDEVEAIWQIPGRGKST